MTKGFFTTLLILVICSLENIGHYFGFCFHGIMANVIGSIGVFAVTFGLYAKDIKIWLETRKYGKRKPHICKDHHHIEGDAKWMTQESKKKTESK